VETDGVPWGTLAGVTLLDRQEAVRDLESRLRRALLIARLGGERLISRDGRLEILRPLGHGASGVVCEALDRKLGRKVALKLYPGIAHDRLALAVRTEAQVLAALRHRNIVVVHDFDAEDFRPGDIRCFLVVMELLSGKTLRNWMTEPHPVADIVEVFCRAGDGLAAAHGREIVHRDFKPENVMLDDDGEPRLVDFGCIGSA
jgi:eukaryotic-like serine/threonine-protein kinase